MFSKRLLESEVSRNILLGADVFYELPSTLKHLQLGKKVLFLRQNTDQITINIEKIAPQLITTGYDVNSWEITAVPHRLLDELLELKPDVVISLGNARCIDITKYLLLQASKQLEYTPEWISIPATAEHDSVCSPYIFLDLDGKGEKIYGRVSTPIAILADTNIIMQSSDRLLAAGIADILSRHTSVWDWKLANRLRGEPISDFVAAISSETIEILCRQLQGIHIGNVEAVPIVMKALIIAGFLSGFADDVRSCYGSEHMFAQALDAQEPGKALHGERVALGTIMMAALQGQDWKKIRSILRQVNVPTTISALSYKTSSIIKALMQANKYPENTELYTILGPGLTEEAALSLALRTGVIENF